MILFLPKKYTIRVNMKIEIYSFIELKSFKQSLQNLPTLTYRIRIDKITWSDYNMAFRWLLQPCSPPIISRVGDDGMVAILHQIQIRDST